VEEQKRELEEANIALKVRLKQRENDKAELELKVLANIKTLVLPYVEKLKLAPLLSRDKTTIEIIDAHLMQCLDNINILLPPRNCRWPPWSKAAPAARKSPKSCPYRKPRFTFTAKTCAANPR
jgi:hypothetical protein